MLKKYKTLEDIEKTDVLEIEGMKELIPKIDKVIGFLELIADQVLEFLPLQVTEEMFEGIPVVDMDQFPVSPGIKQLLEYD